MSKYLVVDKSVSSSKLSLLAKLTPKFLLIMELIEETSGAIVLMVGSPYFFKCSSKICCSSLAFSARIRGTFKSSLNETLVCFAGKYDEFLEQIIYDLLVCKVIIWQFCGGSVFSLRTATTIVLGCSAKSELMSVLEFILEIRRLDLYWSNKSMETLVKRLDKKGVQKRVISSKESN